MAILEPTSTSAKTVRKESGLARIVGSGSAGILELAFFHPVSFQLSAIDNRSILLPNG
jgi:hypothetical protein